MQYTIYNIAKSLNRISKPQNAGVIRKIVNLNNQSDSAYTSMFELMAAQKELEKNVNTIAKGNHMVSSNLAGVLNPEHENFNPFLYQCYLTRKEQLAKYEDRELLQKNYWSLCKVCPKTMKVLCFK